MPNTATSETTAASRALSRGTSNLPRPWSRTAIAMDRLNTLERESCQLCEHGKTLRLRGFARYLAPDGAASVGSRRRPKSSFLLFDLGRAGIQHEPAERELGGKPANPQNHHAHPD